MATQPEATGLTYQDLLRMFPEEDMVRRDLIDGELFVTPAPTFRHQQVIVRLVVALHGFASGHGGHVVPSPFDVVFSDTNVLQPDVLLIGPGMSTPEAHGHLREAPLLAIEVSSPSTRARDVTRKKEIYERFGVLEYWFVDLDADRVEVFRIEGKAYGPAISFQQGQALTSPNLPGLSLPVDEVLGRD